MKNYFLIFLKTFGLILPRNFCIFIHIQFEQLDSLKVYSSKLLLLPSHGKNTLVKQKIIKKKSTEKYSYYL